MNILRERLQDYKDVTIQLINCVETEQYGMLEELFNKRKDIIYDMERIDYEPGEFRYICTELDLIALEKKMDELMSESYKKAKDQLKNIIRGKNINRSYRPGYSKDAYVDSIFLSKKI